MRSFLEHTCIVVNDADWHLKLFEELFGATIKKSRVNPDGSQMYWLTGGYQINQPAVGFEPTAPTGRELYHLGVSVDCDCVKLGELCLARGCLPVPGKKGNWVALPDGAVLELMQQGNPDAIDMALALSAASENVIP